MFAGLLNEQRFEGGVAGVDFAAGLLAGGVVRLVIRDGVIKCSYGSGVVFLEQLALGGEGAELLHEERASVGEIGFQLLQLRGRLLNGFFEAVFGLQRLQGEARGCDV